jgi:hypothetical protein
MQTYQEQSGDVQTELLAAVRSLTSKIEQMNTDNLIRSSSDLCGGGFQMQGGNLNHMQSPFIQGYSPRSFGDIPIVDTDNNMQHAVPRVIFISGQPHLVLDPEPPQNGNMLARLISCFGGGRR